MQGYALWLGQYSL